MPLAFAVISWPLEEAGEMMLDGILDQREATRTLVEFDQSLAARNRDQGAQRFVLFGVGVADLHADVARITPPEMHGEWPRRIDRERGQDRLERVAVEAARVSRSLSSHSLGRTMVTSLSANCGFDDLLPAGVLPDQHVVDAVDDLIERLAGRQAQ